LVDVRLSTASLRDAQGNIRENFEYNLAGSPCETVVGRAPCFYPRNVQQLFPDDRSLVKMGVQSYLGVPLFGAAGQPLGLVTVMHDRPFEFSALAMNLLTAFGARAAELERLEIEAQLRESEEHTRHLALATFEGIGMAEQGRIIQANEQMAQMLGYALNELIGKSVMDVVAPESREEVLEHIRLSDDRPYEHLALRQDGTHFPVEARGRLRSYKGRMVRVTAIRDMTEHKRAEEALRRYADENARLLVAERQHRELAETLREIGATLAATLDADTVLDRLLEERRLRSPCLRHDAGRTLTGFDRLMCARASAGLLLRIPDWPGLGYNRVTRKSDSAPDGRG
jgi:PAS domain S-box-containing protein